MHGGSIGIKIWLSFILGLVFTAMGVGAALSYFGINLPVPSIVFDSLIIEISLIVAGLLLFLFSFSIRSSMGVTRWGNILISILLAAIGAIPLALRYEMLSFLPFIPKHAESAVVVA